MRGTFQILSERFNSGTKNGKAWEVLSVKAIEVTPGADTMRDPISVTLSKEDSKYRDQLRGQQVTIDVTGYKHQEKFGVEFYGRLVLEESALGASEDLSGRAVAA